MPHDAGSRRARGKRGMRPAARDSLADGDAGSVSLDDRPYKFAGSDDPTGLRSRRQRHVAWYVRSRLRRYCWSRSALAAMPAFPHHRVRSTPTLR